MQAVLLAVLAAILVSGCASGPPNPAPAATGGSLKSGAGIPPKVQTLYEQAVAAMAAGEFIEAELQLRTFLLQNPGYPGAHVNLAI
ncbi:MAG: hypothetical protein WD036_09895, partial [Bauldia sp.]